MKFEEFYERNKVQEWRNVYLNYMVLKSMLKPFLEIIKLESHKTSAVERPLIAYKLFKRKQLPKFILPDDLFSKLKQIDDDFIFFCQKEMEKSNRFYILHNQQLQIKFKKLAYNLMIYIERKSAKVYELQFIYVKAQTKKEAKRLVRNYYLLKESAKSLHKECKLLERFSHDNRQAMKKIIKHYREKVFFLKSTEANVRTLNDNEARLEIFQESYILTQLIQDVESLYAQHFTRNPKLGLQILKLQSKGKIFTEGNLFYFGLYIGIAIVIILSIILQRVELIKYFNPDYDLYFPMFRGLILVFSYYWLLTLNVYGWNRGHVNYKQIFRFNYHSSSMYQILKRASFFSMAFLTIFILSLNREIYDQQIVQQGTVYVNQLNQYIFNPALGPLMMWAIFIVYMVFPSRKFFNAKGRYYFWVLMWHCLTSAFKPVSFPISWTTDQFVSFVGTFKDVDYTVCFYANYFSGNKEPTQCASSKRIESGLIIAIFPLVLRMIQCSRQGYDKGQFLGTDFFYNFMKYTVSLITATISYTSKFYPNLFYPWVFFAFVSACYSYYWDVIKDWCFFQSDTKYRFLRRRLAYDSPNYYYAIMIVNIFLRFTWILSISPNTAIIFGIWPQMFTFIISLLELIRRCLWNFIRVEKEHVVNMGDFKAVPDMVLPYEEEIKEITRDTLQQPPINRTHPGSDQASLSITEQTKSHSETIYRNSTQMLDLINFQHPQSLKEKISLLESEEQKLLQNFIVEDQNEEIEFRATFGEFKRRVSRLNSEYPLTLMNIQREVKEIEGMIEKMTADDIQIKDKSKVHVK